jgi:hypothetical protein
MKPSPEEIREAKKIPGGWVYVFDAPYDPSKYVPPHAIRGAWKVDNDGNIVGEFIPNPNYRPDQPADTEGNPSTPAY